MASDDEVAAFLASHDDATQLESGKVLCKTTGHELLPQLELLQAHWGGKTYKKKVRPEYHCGSAARARSHGGRSQRSDLT
jgi:hypothetical protein